MRTMLLAMGLALVAGMVAADGVGMTKDYHFTYKPETCYTLKLTAEQIKDLEGDRNADYESTGRRSLITGDLPAG